jgi:(1->4)-alpha-D-glucan 1-alpha-D-glucosylmutase
MNPRATYRLQLNKDFTFAEAGGLVPYLADLGISHLYASPIFTARPGSLHGYDVIDPTRVNPELGGETGLRELVARLRQAGLGLIVDIVPNHMYAGPGNEWWTDVLYQGRESPFAKFFDIDWRPANPSLKDKILLPILGRPLDEALANGDLTLSADGQVLRYFDRELPIAAESLADADGLPALLERQHYRLACWRAAADEINWRRFFDINELVGVRVEDAEVFEAMHKTLFSLYAEGLIDGVRVDHVDGLANPGRYCRALRARLSALEGIRPQSAPAGPPYIVVEKILGRSERLPRTWQTDGAVGYDFMNEVSAVLHDPAGETDLTALWTEISGRSASFESEEIAARREILKRSFGGQFEALAAALLERAHSGDARGDLSGATIERSLLELLARFRIYRSYEPDDDQEKFFAAALDAARQACPGERRALKEIGRLIRQSSELRVNFQQLTAPLAAKAVEDTALYRYGRLLSRNDVGFDPARFAMSPDDFHAAMQARLSTYPNTLLETATHDHKRGEDVRARLAVLSEMPEEWSRAVRTLLVLNTGLRKSVAGSATLSPGDELMLYQMIVGAWPTELTVADKAGCASFVQRLAAWQQKALREAKLRTDWSAPHEAYENAAQEFLLRLFSDGSAGLQLLGSFAHRIAAAGAVNGLTQLLLKLTVPGVPDFYQGTEFWDLSLVDPDNRRAVDYGPHRIALRQQQPPLRCIPFWRDGRLKQAVIARVLAARRDCPRLFADGDYRALAVRGRQADRVIAFVRRKGAAAAWVIVTRFASRLLDEEDTLAIAPDRWEDTYLELPGEIVGCDLENILSGGHLRVVSEMPVAELLRDLPIALFLCRSD